jgi:tetratricopeptide (TPR) repeat protein
MKKNIALLFVTGLVLLGLLVIGSAIITPQVSADAGAMEAANRLYQAGNYHEAGRIYEQIVAQGVQDSTVYFNLGNAYYRQGDLGRAIVNYQRAALLNPRDADIKANLELTREQTGIVLGLENVLANVPGPLGMLRELTGNWLTVNETAVLALAFWFLAGLLLLGWRLWAPGKGRSTFKLAAIMVLFILLLTGLSLGTRIYTEQALPGGVVIAPSVAISTEPGEQFTTEYTLQSGTEVSVAETNGNWARLAVPGDAVESWVPLDAVELVAGGQFAQAPIL